MEVAQRLGLSKERVYKTLVLVGKSGQYYVAVIPVAEELDLKKAARCIHEKSCELLHLKDLTKVTGYVRGGCTALGMKKQFPTVIDASAEPLDYIYVSGGKLGIQICLAPKDLQKVSRAEFEDIVFHKE